MTTKHYTNRELGLWICLMMSRFHRPYTDLIANERLYHDATNQLMDNKQWHTNYYFLEEIRSDLKL